MRQVIGEEKVQAQYLKPVGAKANSCMNNDRFSEANVNLWYQDNEWSTQVDVTGSITLTILFDQKVCERKLSPLCSVTETHT